MTFSCPSCSFTTKYKGNFGRHSSKCSGEPLVQPVFLCKKCMYSTESRSNFERHQNSDICHRKASTEKSLRQEIDELKKYVYKMNEWFEGRPKTAEEIKEEEEKVAEDIKRKLTKHGVEFDKYESLDGLRAKNRDLTAKLNLLKTPRVE